MKLLRWLIIAACIVFILFGCWKIYSIQSGYHQSEQAYEELEAFIVIPEAPAETKPTATAPTEAASEETPETTEPQEIVNFPVVDFDALRGASSSIVGWIYGKGTPINYPVVQWLDNDYYLDHLYDGQPNGSGAIFLNSRNNPDFTDQNNIIFGHNMNNGSMFAGLSNFKNQNYYEEHPRFLLMTPEGNYVADIFAGVVMGEWDDIWKTSFADDTEMENWLRNIESKSLIYTDVTPTVKDTILTLSTCSYEYNGARFTVVCVLKKVD